jgi:hypothetical protein
MMSESDIGAMVATCSGAKFLNFVSLEIFPSVWEF